MKSGTIPIIRAAALSLFFALAAGACAGEAGNAPAADAKPAAAEKSWAGTLDAPEFPDGLDWLNVPAQLKFAQLRGKVVLLDFWTYGCINCMHNLPYIKKLQAEFADELVVIGVHSAKFATEGQTDSLRAIALRYGLTYPLVNDHDFIVWRMWGANAWPTLLLVDPAGKVVGGSNGEGFYDTYRAVISSLVKEFDAKKMIDRKPLATTPEKDRAPASILAFPGKVLADGKGKRLFIADSGHNRILVAALADGSVSGIAGGPDAGFADGSFADARFSAPQGMALSPDGNTLYVADTANHSIRALDLAARRVSTLAGTGKQAAAYPPENGVGTAAALSSPWDLALDGSTLYAALAGSHQIWTIDTATGAAEALAGTGAEGWLDAPAAEAELAQPSGLALGTDGKLYFADSEASSIRSVDLRAPGHPVATVAGSGESLFEFGAEDGTGKAARFQHPLGVAWLDGALYVADTYNHRVRRVNPASGKTTTIAGGEAGYRNGADAAFSELGGISASGGRLYLADTNNHAVRTVDAATGAAGALVVKGLERFAAGFALPAEKPLVLPEAAVAPGDGEVRIVVDLPSGYKPNPEAASSFKLSVRGKGITLPGFSEIVRPGPSFPVSFPARFDSGKGTLVLEIALVYCETENETLCLLERRTVELPFRVKKGGAKDIELRYAVE